MRSLIQAMEPPPAPIDLTSIAGMLVRQRSTTGMKSWARSSPPAMTPMSKEVPPMSVKTTLSWPAEPAELGRRRTSRPTGPALWVSTARGARDLLAAAGIVHEDQRFAVTLVAQLVAEPAELLAHHPMDVGVHHRGHRPRVLARLRRDFARQYDRHRAEVVLGVLLLDDLRRAARGPGSRTTRADRRRSPSRHGRRASGAARGRPRARADTRPRRGSRCARARRRSCRAESAVAA